MLNGREALGLTLLAVFLIFPIAVSRFPHNGDPEKTPPLIALQKRIGLEQLNSGLFFIAGVMWALIFASLFFGLLSTIWLVISNETPTTSDDVWDWRFTLVGMAALTATLGAVVALPFTLVRLTYVRRQTDTATQALFNDKIDAAVSDLHAQRQITKWDEKVAQNGWEDDVTRRNGAIDRLHGLAKEEPEAASRIARMLSVYVKELSREYPAKIPPSTDDLLVLKAWAENLVIARSDMQNAVQVLGKLRAESGKPLDEGEIDLSGVNLQGFNLVDLNFEGVLFSKAEMQGANLMETNLQRASLDDANLQGSLFLFAKLQRVDFYGTNLRGADLSHTNMREASFHNLNLSEVDFKHARMRRASIEDANLQNANLSHVNLQGAFLVRLKIDSASSFTGADFRGAMLKRVDFTKTQIHQKQFQSMFGDTSTVLNSRHEPTDSDRPAHWSKEDLDIDEFHTQWHAFQRSIGQNPNNPK